MIVNNSTDFHSHKVWNRERPNVLVIACSDGRLQEAMDDFLQNRLGITRYDRLYAPGGPGALAPSGVEYLRSDLFRRECLFLVEAHSVDDVYLVFHGPGDDGPDEAVCADYRRIFPTANAAQVRAQQEQDAAQVVGAGFGWQRHLRVHVYRCEVGADTTTRWVPMQV